MFLDNLGVAGVVNKVDSFPRVLIEIEKQSVGVFSVFISIPRDKLRMTPIDLTHKRSFGNIAYHYSFETCAVIKFLQSVVFVVHGL